MHENFSDFFSDQLSSPTSDADLTYYSLPSTKSMGDAPPRINRRPEPTRQTKANVGPFQPFNYDSIPAAVKPSSFRQQHPPADLLKSSKYPHKEQLFVAISNHDEDSCTDMAEPEDEAFIDRRGGASVGPRSTMSSDLQRRVKFSAERPLLQSTATRGGNQGSGQQLRQGSIPSQYETPKETWYAKPSAQTH
jgi:hypothetical protein